MSHEGINQWVQKAKTVPGIPDDQKGIVVIKCADAANKGRMIMEVAEKIRPLLMKLFEGVRDKSGMLMQPAHIRGVALNVAQDLVNEHNH